jgi:hypothetical protein
MVLQLSVTSMTKGSNKKQRNSAQSYLGAQLMLLFFFVSNPRAGAVRTGAMK